MNREQWLTDPVQQLRPTTTPGPWTIGEDESTSKAHEILGKRGQCVGWTASNEPYEEGNARLIAAAPEMRQLLDSFVQLRDAGDWPAWSGAAEMRTVDSLAKLEDDTRALLAKIEGKEAK